MMEFNGTPLSQETIKKYDLAASGEIDYIDFADNRKEKRFGIHILNDWSVWVCDSISLNRTNEKWFPSEVKSSYIKRKELPATTRAKEVIDNGVTHMYFNARDIIDWAAKENLLNDSRYCNFIKTLEHILMSVSTAAMLLIKDTERVSPFYGDRFILKQDAKEVRAHDNISIRWNGRPINHEQEAEYGIIASGCVSFELNKDTSSAQDGAILMHVLYNSNSIYGYDYYCMSGLTNYIECIAPKGIKELPVINIINAYGKDYGVDKFYDIDVALKFLKDDNKTDSTIYKLLYNIRQEWNAKEVISKLRSSADEYFNDHHESTDKD